MIFKKNQYSPSFKSIEHQIKIRNKIIKIGLIVYT